MSTEDFFWFKRISEIEVDTNVNHLISYKSPDGHLDMSDFNWGYMGTGPHELSANILWLMNVAKESDCIRWASSFSEEVLNYLPYKGGEISKSTIRKWIKDKDILIRV